MGGLGGQGGGASSGRGRGDARACTGLATAHSPPAASSLGAGAAARGRRGAAEHGSGRPARAGGSDEYSEGEGSFHTQEVVGGMYQIFRSSEFILESCGPGEGRSHVFWYSVVLCDCRAWR